MFSSGYASCVDGAAERAEQDRPLAHVLGLDGDGEEAGLGELLLAEQLLDLEELLEGVGEDVGGSHIGSIVRPQEVRTLF